jgi:Putative transposase
VAGTGSAASSQAAIDRAVLSLPIPLRLLLTAQPQLLTLVLQVVHRMITRFLLDQARLKATEADSGAVTLIQRFGSAANLNIHLHCLVLDGVYRRGADGEPQFVGVLGGELKIVAAILEAPVIEKILTHLGLQARAPARGQMPLYTA